MQEQTQVPVSPEEELQQGVTSEHGAPQDEQGVAEQNTADSELAADLEKLKAEYEEEKKKAEANLRGLQASYDKQIAQIRQEGLQQARQWEDQYHQKELEGKDELGRAEYLLSVAEKRLDDASSQIQELENRAHESQNMASYLSTFIQAGVSPDKLDMSNVTALVNSGWKALNEDLQSLRVENEELRKRSTNPESREQPNQQGDDLQPPDVAGGEKGTPRQGPSNVKESMDAAEAILGTRPATFGDLQEMVLKGRLPVEILPGMDGYPQGDKSQLS